ncbi:MAG: phosphoribosylformylglycinamidine synthase subunit PurQ [Myxococcales bacterium]|nr:phosphoribosylformylglycinamidine synthase subunit PurQ [Myxococcales bacterium]
MLKRPPALVLQAPGSNRDLAAARALTLAGAAPTLLTVGELVEAPERLADFRFLLLPGGFSFGDDLGAGRLWAATLRDRLAEPLARFVEAGRPILGICNGFQALVKLGLLPGRRALFEAEVTLTHNASGQFACRPVFLTPEPGTRSIFCRALTAPIVCPVAHGEGRLAASPATLAALEAEGLVALRYARADGGPVAWPDNPNGSPGHIAGLCNPAGNILGLMPHPEDHVLPTQHPGYLRGASGHSGLPLFQAGVAHALQLD